MSRSQPLCQTRAPAVPSPPRACRARRLPSASWSHAHVTSFFNLLSRGPRVPSCAFFLATPRATRLRVDPVFPVVPRFSPINARRVLSAGPSCQPLVPASNESAPSVLLIANFRRKLMRRLRQTGWFSLASLARAFYSGRSTCARLAVLPAPTPQAMR